MEGDGDGRGDVRFKGENAGEGLLGLSEDFIIIIVMPSYCLRMPQAPVEYSLGSESVAFLE